MKHCRHRQTDPADAGFKDFDGFSQAACTSDFMLKLWALTAYTSDSFRSACFHLHNICVVLLQMSFMRSSPLMKEE